MQMKTTKFVLSWLPLFASFVLACYCHRHCKATEEGGSATGIKGMFVFGSSMVDNGNNNFLQNLAKANYLPYGIDFPGGPSGRFTNGKNVVDLLGEMLMLPGWIPAFADPATKGSRIVHGVNFASGGSGILDDTGSTVGHVLSLKEQIKKFEEVTLPELEAETGCRSSESLSKYLFIVGAGGNDYSFNYFRPSSSSSTSNASFDTNILDKAFAAHLINSLSQHLKKLYSLGGRKFVLMSVYPIGCSPMAKALMKKSGCLEELNRGVGLFNAALKSMVDTNAIHPHDLPLSTHLVYVDQYKIISDIIDHPTSKAGFVDARRPCCKVGGNGVSCTRNGPVCKDRTLHVYFDGLHPTEAVNIHIANKAFASNLSNEVYPINVSKLANL